MCVIIQPITKERFGRRLHEIMTKIAEVLKSNLLVDGLFLNIANEDMAEMKII